MAPTTLKIKLLFGLLEADASGTLAICAALACVILVGAGRRLKLW